MSGTLAGLSSPSNSSSDLSMAVSTFMTAHEERPYTDSLTAHDPAADKTRGLIDQEMQRLENSIRLLKSRRNILAPISRLPPEMLAKIFAHRVAECAESPNLLEWIRVSHVSRHWRAVALDCPSLWGNLVFTRPKWSEEMLKRSKMASLVVKADLTCITPRIFEAVRLALLHGSRIHDLQLRAASATLDRLLAADLSLEMPMIRSLSLSVPRVARFGTDEGFTIPTTILNGPTPYLKRLELQKCNISWDSSLLRGLTHLTIRDVTASARPTTQQLMDALERMPGLQVFDFQDALPLSPQTEAVHPPPDRIIHLPQLIHLSIASTVPECVNLVSRITIPASARVHLSCSGTEATGSDFSGIMKIISNPRCSSCPDEIDSPPERKIIRVLHVQVEAPVSLLVHGWTDPLSPSENDVRANAPDIQLHLSWHHSPQAKVDAIATSICKAIPIAHLRSLRMAHVGGMTPKTWANTFGFLPKLHSVHIAGDSAHTFIAALREEVPVEALLSPVTPGRMLGVKRPGLRRRRSAVPAGYFPSLKSLTLEDVSFEEHVGTFVPFRYLQECIKERSERKVALQELRLRECSHLYEEMVDLLEQTVPTVDWDGFEPDAADAGSLYGYEEMGGYIFGGYNYDEDLELDLDLGLGDF
ncbi:hypothetical protein LshimejAT787_1005130 [Lyophyllum shimeji]|uniref:F-box domain-containing protein n=1 Tax=Lyophyllum shimeji TaxID=47721 RepID=A0A9P3PUP8_LYOSH|nr:hypothetical protein LshimejAT787_1005130 [Lyophyllum shimeji]